MPSVWRPCLGPATALSAKRSWKKACWKKKHATNLPRDQKDQKEMQICISFLFDLKDMWLVKIEGDFNIHFNCYGAAVFLGRIEFPGLYTFNGFLVQAHAQRADDARVMHAAICTHNDVQHHHALIFGFARFFRELRFRSINRARRTNAFTHMEDSRTHARTAVA